MDPRRHPPCLLLRLPHRRSRLPCLPRGPGECVLTLGTRKQYLECSGQLSMPGCKDLLVFLKGQLTHSLMPLAQQSRPEQLAEPDLAGQVQMTEQVVATEQQAMAESIQQAWAPPSSLLALLSWPLPSCPPPSSWGLALPSGPWQRQSHSP